MSIVRGGAYSLLNTAAVAIGIVQGFLNEAIDTDLYGRCGFGSIVVDNCFDTSLGLVLMRFDHPGDDLADRGFFDLREHQPAADITNLGHRLGKARTYP